MKLSPTPPVRAGVIASARPPRRQRFTDRMRVGLLALLSLFMATGCQKDVSQRDAYIRELRMQEDQIYELQDYMTEYQELLRRKRRENSRLQEQLASQSTTAPSHRSASEEGGERIDDDIDDDTDERSLLDRPGKAKTTDDETGIPKIDLGEPAMPEIDLGEPTTGPEELPEIKARSGGVLRDRPTAVRQVSAYVAVEQDIEEESVDTETLFTPPPVPIKLANSCALYAEQIPVEPNGQEKRSGAGLMVIVEPLTHEGSAGAFAGQVSLMLLDPIAGDNEKEIARWNFTPEEVEAAWRDASRRVLDLPIAAPATVPIGRPLELWVRLLPIQRDQKILTHTGIELVDPTRLIGVPVSGGGSSTLVGGRVSSGWTAADPLRSPIPSAQGKRPATWHPAALMPAAAVARAEALDDAPPMEEETPLPGDIPSANGPFPPNIETGDWAPFR